MKWIPCLLPWLLAAQSPEPFGPDSRFADGVYLTHAALLANQPDVEWSDISGEMVQLAEDQRVQIDGFGYKSGRQSGVPYAISLDGMPYLFVRHDARRRFYEFAGLRVAGRYSAISYDTTVHLRRLMKAYNPVNGRAFREAWVERDQQREVSRVIDMTDGRRLPLDKSTVQELLAREEDLVAALDRSEVAEEPKMLRALMIYNERHPLPLPVPQANR